MRKTTFDEMLTHLLILDTMLVIFFLVDAMTTIVFQSSPNWYKVLYPFVIHPGKTISMSATVFMVVAVSADRQRAICHPMLYRVSPYVIMYPSLSEILGENFTDMNPIGVCTGKLFSKASFKNDFSSSSF